MAKKISRGTHQTLILDNRTILHGDVLEKLKVIPDNSVDLINTSPPYFGLRNYGVKGQIGLEPSFKDFLAVMQKIMKECKRVLKPTGVCWINLGDTYNQNTKGNRNRGASKKFKEANDVLVKSIQDEMQPKSRMGIPERFYIDCIDNGWVARNHIPWIKANHMPSSVKDRFTNKWESVFFFSKTSETNFFVNNKTKMAVDILPKNPVEGVDYELNEKKEKVSFWRSVNYYFDLDAVRVKPITGYENNRPTQKTKQDNKVQYDLNGNVIGDSTNPIHEKYTAIDSNVSRLHKDREGNPHNKKQDNVLGADGKPKANYSGFNDRWKARNNKAQDQYGARTAELRAAGADHDNAMNHPNGKNPGDVIDLKESTTNNRKHQVQTIHRTHSGTVNTETGESLNHPNGKNPGDIMDLKENKFETGKWRQHYDKDGNCLGCGKSWRKHTVSQRAKGSIQEASKRTEDVVWCNPAGKNPGDVMKLSSDYTDDELLEWIKLCRENKAAWDLAPPDLFYINPKPFPEAHFATFPVELPKRILSCCCPDQVCCKCSKPRIPITKTEKSDCGCNAGFKPGVCLDIFFGAGTTAVAAEQLGLQWIGIELNKEYIEIARKRLEPYANQALGEFVNDK